MPDTPLVLLHAFPLDSRMWDGPREALSARTRLITPDLRGFGSAPLGVEPPDLAVLAADVLALLDDLGLDRVHLGGCSMGGYVAMALLRAAPERVATLLLVDTKATADTDDARTTRLATATRAEREGVASWLAEAMVPTLFADPARGARARELIDAQDPAAVAWAQRAMAARPDSADTLRAVRVPTLVVHGEKDGLMPLALAEDMAALTGGELAVVPGSGHLPPMETPDAFAKIVTAWLDRA